MITTVTVRNRVAIPAKLAEQLAIQPGTRIDWSVSDAGVLIARPLPDSGVLARQVAGMGRAWLPPGADPVAELIKERVQEDGDEGLA